MKEAGCGEGWGEKLTYRETKIRIIFNFSEIMKERREWDEIVKMLKEKTYHIRILYPAKLSFKTEAGIKIFSGKQKLTEFVNSRPAIQEMLKYKIHQKEEK